MMGLLCVGAGGALGAMGRYGLGLIPLGSELPLMTLLINFLGSVAIGAIVETSELAAGALSREAVLFLKVGLCGGFTTFSTFSLETLELIEGGQYAIAGAYALVSVVLCVAGVLVGKVLARALMPTGSTPEEPRRGPWLRLLKNSKGSKTGKGAFASTIPACK